MGIYNLSCGWQVSAPDLWKHQYDDISGQYIFWQDKSSLTVRITPFHASKNGVPAPGDVMEKAFRSSVPKSAELFVQHPYGLQGFKCLVFKDVYKDRGKSVYTIYIGYWREGDLLSISLWATDPDEFAQADEILGSPKAVGNI